ncbi:hypothetical protein Tco_1413350, partial [Tanacetum coccineum]
PHDNEYDHTGPHDTEDDNMRQHDTEYDHTGQHDTKYDNMGQHDHTGRHDTDYDHMGQHDTKSREYLTCIIKEVLDEFKVASGLVPSLPKSTAFFCNVLNHIKLSILQVLPFEEGKLPVKYLGVLLVFSRLRIRDSNKLVDRVQLRIQDWKNKSLSIAGRLQLIQSVLGSMHIYWASVFMLPTNVLHNIE